MASISFSHVDIHPTFTLLWENASPTTAFAGQTITLPFIAANSEYFALLIIVRYWYTSERNYSKIIFRQDYMKTGTTLESYLYTDAIYAYSSESAKSGRRLIEWTGGNQITVGGGWWSGSGNNGFAIPYKIFGINFPAEYIDDSFNTIRTLTHQPFTYTGTYQYIVNNENDWELKLLTSGELIIHPKFPVGGSLGQYSANDENTYDIFLMGGGGSGGAGSGGGGGGGAGFITQIFNAQLPAGTIINATIGAGGASVKGNVDGNPGEETSLLPASAYSWSLGYETLSVPNLEKISRSNTSTSRISYWTAAGGYGGKGNGGYGGSGSSGGGKGNNVSSPVAGGIPGTKGLDANNVNSTDGQGYSSQYFSGDQNKPPYYTSKFYENQEWRGGGGGGGGYKRGGCAGNSVTANGLAASGTGGASAAANTGAGGGGAGGNATTYTSGAGGSGIIIIRPHKPLPEYAASV